jgi:hypothetical protein
VTRPLLALAAYLVLAAVYTHPLLPRSRDAIANDRYDPVLNASILWWNATTVPFSPGWWTPPHFFPSERIAVFTENLVGLGPITTPLYHATGDPLLTYNLAVFLTWPLSALAVFLLATSLGVRAGPAFVGGLVFGFAPYRTTQMAHLQVLACFWLPVALAALHRYLADGRTAWLVVFGGAWALQSLTNGYFMLFGGLLIGAWLLFFCSTPAGVRRAPAIALAWILASLPLLPVLLEYKRVHAAYGLERPLGAIIHYSAQASAWVQASPSLTWWGRILPDGSAESNLFPGLTAVLIVAVAAGWGWWHRARVRPAAPALHRTWLRALAGGLALIASAVIVYTLAVGPWRASILGVTVRISSIDRALLVAIICWIAYLWPGRRPHAWSERRSPFAFYLAATLAIVVLCMGPEFRAGDRVVLESAPYRWLLVLPGFEGLRVPTRFWMIGAMCLAAAAALGLDRLAPASRRGRAALVALASAAVLADGWMPEMPMGRAPEHWSRVERRDTQHALIELPLGPEYDAAATYRAVRHRRRVVNGVSGYDPPHYEWLQRGLNARDPGALLALTAFGPLDVVVDGAADDDGSLARYVAAIPGAEETAGDGVRTAYRLPGTLAAFEPGAAWPLHAVRAAPAQPDMTAAVDGRLDTAWTLAPQSAGDRVEIDLGSVREVSGVGSSQGTDIGAYPRRLAVDVSTDGATWQTRWEGEGFPLALAGLMRTPRDARLWIPFAPVAARYVRLRLLDAAGAPWTIAELIVHGGGS